MLAACGGQPPRPADSGPTAEPTSKPSPRATRKSSVVQKRGGGYYKDDGPGEDIPDGLDDLPDAEPRAEPLHRFANRPYVVLGKAYTPKTAVEPFRQRGIGSWYGKKFHGQKTSIGEPYDMFAMTAAHPTLPLPSYVRVTNVANGRSVVVRLTDRGPFHAERVIDLSYAAAYRLDYIDNGSAQVEVEQVVPNDPTGLTYAQVAPPLKSASATARASAQHHADGRSRRLGRAHPAPRAPAAARSCGRAERRKRAPERAIPPTRRLFQRRQRRQLPRPPAARTRLVERTRRHPGRRRHAPCPPGPLSKPQRRRTRRRPDSPGARLHADLRHPLASPLSPGQNENGHPAGWPQRWANPITRAPRRRATPRVGANTRHAPGAATPAAPACSRPGSGCRAGRSRYSGRRHTPCRAWRSHPCPTR